jgi:peptidoglycan/LPS O-acetylase OafA/YrhL
VRIKELDGLRGVAVLAVVGTHYFAWFPMPAVPQGHVGNDLFLTPFRFIIGCFRLGWLGVDLFFILSGFLITSILMDLRDRDKEQYFRGFYARRALRIFPPYYLGILVFILFSFARGLPGTWGLWLQYIFYYTSVFVGQPSQLRAVVPVLPIVVISGLLVLWSLSVEEIYYTIWAPVVRYTTRRGLSAILVGMIVVAPLLRWWLHTPEYPEVYTFYCRMDGLAYGSAVALLLRDRRLNPSRWLHTDRFFDWLGMVVVPLSVLFWVASGGSQKSRIVCTLGLVLADLSLALFAHALIRRANGQQWWVRVTRANWLRSVGMVSYSLYLFHAPLHLVAASLVSHLQAPEKIRMGLVMMVGLILSFAVAYGLWYGLESRILRWKDRNVPSTAHPESSPSKPLPSSVSA